MLNVVDRKISISTDTESIRHSITKAFPDSLEKEFYENLKFEDTNIFDNEQENMLFDNACEEEAYESDDDEYDFKLITKRAQPKQVGRRNGCPCRSCCTSTKKDIFAYEVKSMERELVELLMSPKEEEINIDLKPFNNLIEEFALANIKLKLISKPSQFLTSKRQRIKSDTTNFLMDLRTTNKKTGYGQYFIIYPGTETTIEVLNVNKEYKQLILMVHEPEREMTVETSRWDDELKKYVTDINIIKNEAEIRHFLIGHDEGHLFVALMNKNVLTVEQAHKSLMPFELRNKPKSYYKRQGEWFFVPVSGLIIPPETVVETKDLQIGTGRGHKAQYHVTVDGNVYVKGTIIHPDHKTLTLKDWHRVYNNNEDRQRQEIAKGITWID
jgi:hypothetical protein